jgi:hypothetical protein
MTGIVYKFPYNVSRRVYSRMGRVSKNGTPEERAVKAAKAQPEPASLANVVQLRRKPVEPITPLTSEEFRAALDKLDPCGYAEIAALVESFTNKNAN